MGLWSGWSAATPTAYVANQRSDDVSVADADTHSAIDTLSTGAFPAAVGFSPLGRFAFVANGGAAADPTPDSVSVFHVPDGASLGEVPVGDSPRGLASSPDGRLLLVAIQGRAGVSDGGVDIVDAAAAWSGASADAVVSTVPTGGDPADIAVSPDGRFAYVTNFVFAQDNVVFVLDLSLVVTDPEHAVVDTIPVGNSPLGIAVTPDGRRAYVANFAFGSNRVSVIDTEAREELTTVKVGSRPADVAISPDGRYAYVTNLISDSVSVIEIATNEVRATVNVGRAPQGLAFTPGGAFVYVANRQSLETPLPGDVSVIDTGRALTSPGQAVIGGFDVGMNPVAVAIAPASIPAGVTRAIFAPIPPVDADVNEDEHVTAADVVAAVVEGGGEAPL